uniref:Uncharacterized protein n=1 Tax=Amphimedon queenslandica TaxID=400682 RepID=A0A1X7VAP8_AMPQE
MIIIKSIIDPIKWYICKSNTTNTQNFNIIS